jgi:hypothetical protein
MVSGGADAGWATALAGCSARPAVIAVAVNEAVLTKSLREMDASSFIAEIIRSSEREMGKDRPAVHPGNFLAIRDGF